MGRIATNNYCKDLAGLSLLPSGITYGNQCPTKAVILSAYGDLLILNSNNYSNIQLVQEQDLARNNWFIKVGLYNSQRCKDRKFIKNIYFTIADNFGTGTDLASRKSLLLIYLYIPNPPDQQAPNSTDSYPNTDIVTVQNGSNYNGFTVNYKIYDGYNLSMNGTLGTPTTCNSYNVRVDDSYDFRNKFLVGIGYRGWFGDMPGALSVEDFNLYIGNPSNIDVYAPPALITLKDSDGYNYLNINYSDGNESYNPLKFANKVDSLILIIQNLKPILTSKTTLVNNGEYYIEDNNDGISIETEDTLDFVHNANGLHFDKTITGYSVVNGQLHLNANAWKSQRCNNMYYTRISWHGVNRRYQYKGNDGMHYIGSGQDRMSLMNCINFDLMTIDRGNTNAILSFLRTTSYISDVHIRITYRKIEHVNSSIEYDNENEYTIETCVNIPKNNNTYQIGSSSVNNSVTVCPYDQDQRNFLVGYYEDGKYSYLAHTSPLITIYKIEIEYTYEDVQRVLSTHSGDINKKIVQIETRNTGGNSQNNQNEINTVAECQEFNPNLGYPIPTNASQGFDQVGFTIGIPQFECVYNLCSFIGLANFRILNSSNIGLYQFGNLVNEIGINADCITSGHEPLPAYFHCVINNNVSGKIRIELLGNAGSNERAYIACGSSASSINESSLRNTYTNNGDYYEDASHNNAAFILRHVIKENGKWVYTSYDNSLTSAINNFFLFFKSHKNDSNSNNTIIIRTFSV